MKGMMARYYGWRLKRRRERAVKRSMHEFTNTEIWLALYLIKPLYRLWNLVTLRSALFCYTGNCPGCASPLNRFYVPVLGKLKSDYLPDDRVWFMLRNVSICPHCGTPAHMIGIFKTYNITGEINELLEKVKERAHE